MVRPAKSGRESSAAARTGRSRRTTEPARAATPRCAEAGSKLSGVSGPERRPAEQEDSGGEANGREWSHDADADWATRRPGDPATRRPGDPATRLNYTLGTLGGACQPPSRHRHDPESRFPTLYSGGDIRPNPVQPSRHDHLPCLRRRVRRTRTSARNPHASLPHLYRNSAPGERPRATPCAPHRARRGDRRQAPHRARRAPAPACARRTLPRAHRRRGRVGGVVTEPLPPQTRACAIDALGSSPDRFAQGVSSLVRKSRNAAPSPVRLSTAVSCTCWWNSGLPPAFPISGSVQVTPRFPPAGPDGHGSPPSAVLSGRYDFLPSHGLRLIGFASRLRGCLSGSCPPWALPPSCRPGDGPGSGFHAGNPLSSVLARGQEQDLPGSLAIHPVTLRRSTTPDDPLRLACSGASGAAPTRLTMRASSLDRFRGCTPLHHPLSTLHDGRYRTPCKTRFRLAGCAFAGRESNPLDRDERFQLMSSSSPGLSLAQ